MSLNKDFMLILILNDRGVHDWLKNVKNNIKGKRDLQQEIPKKQRVIDSQSLQCLALISLCPLKIKNLICNIENIIFSSA
jgi:hypothetical protein